MSGTSMIEWLRISSLYGQIIQVSSSSVPRAPHLKAVISLHPLQNPAACRGTLIDENEVC